MKKIIILCSAIFLFVLSTKAQTFTFYRGDTPLGNNAEFTVSEASLDEFDALVIESGLSLKNLTNATIETTATQIVQTAPPDESYGVLNFCFERCQEGNVSQSQKKAIEPNVLISPPDFHLCYFPFDESYTKVKVKYEVFPTNKPADRISVTVTYDYNENSTGLENILYSENTIKASQTGNRIQFNYSFDAAVQLEMYNVIGKKVAYHLLDSEGIFVLPEELPKGIYIYTIRNNKKLIVTNKLIIK